MSDAIVPGDNNTNMSDEMVSVSFDIILNAGDARNFVKEALEEVENFNFDNAEKKMIEAKNKITLAHRAQTKVLQKETSGEAINYSVLFSHAQDTLMTINSEYILANQLIKVFKQFDNKINGGLKK